MTARAVPALRVRGLRKAFGGNVAVRGVDLDVGRAEVRGLVGENGAGKSTLVKIVTGALAQDAGTVEIGGRLLKRPSPALANELGITALHQERFIADDLSVAENVLLGQVPTRFGAVDWRSLRRRAKSTIDDLGLELDPGEQAGRLSISKQQQVELARAMSRESQIIVMDEPTASLSGGEVNALFEIIRRLHAAEKTVIYISHHLEELFQVATSVTVLRDGSVVGTYPIEDLDPDRLVSLMFGRSVAVTRRSATTLQAEESRTEDIVLRARDVVRKPYLRGASLDLRRGEIVGIAGGITSGRRELARCLAGVLDPDGGTVDVAQGASGPQVGGGRRKRIAFVADDRKREGIAPDLSVIENIELTRLGIGRTPFVNPRRQARRAAHWMRELRIRAAHPRIAISNLSGGNQQKAILARWLNVDSEIFVLDEPTAGVDVNTRLELYDHLRALAARGAGFVVFSSDYEELRLLADRVLVLHRGVIVKELAPENVSEESLFALEAG